MSSAGVSRSARIAVAQLRKAIYAILFWVTLVAHACQTQWVSTHEKTPSFLGSITKKQTGAEYSIMGCVKALYILMHSEKLSPINIGCGSMDDMPCILNYCLTGIVERFPTECDIETWWLWWLKYHTHGWHPQLLAQVQTLSQLKLSSHFK